jgi:hypothetical protein
MRVNIPKTPMETNLALTRSHSSMESIMRKDFLKVGIASLFCGIAVPTFASNATYVGPADDAVIEETDSETDAEALSDRSPPGPAEAQLAKTDFSRSTTSHNIYRQS